MGHIAMPKLSLARRLISVCVIASLVGGAATLTVPVLPAFSSLGTVGARFLCPSSASVARALHQRGELRTLVLCINEVSSGLGEEFGESEAMPVVRRDAAMPPKKVHIPCEIEPLRDREHTACWRERMPLLQKNVRIERE